MYSGESLSINDRDYRLETVLAAMCEPQVAIVSLTITEKGYCHSPATGQLMLDHPLIAADLENPLQPKSAPGVASTSAVEIRIIPKSYASSSKPISKQHRNQQRM